MSWRDGLALALRSIARRPARTALTILGIALGSGLLVALVAIGQVADSQVIGKLGKGGPATAIRVVPNRPSATQLGTDAIQSGAANAISAATLDSIAKAPGVTTVLPVISQSVYIVPGPLGSTVPSPAGDDPDRGMPQPYFDTLIGVDLAQSGNLPVTLLAGRLPAAGSLTEVAVTAGYLDQLHLDSKKPAAVLGTVIEIGAPQVADVSSRSVRSRWTRAAITAVVAQEMGGGNVLASQQLAAAQRAWQVAGVDGRDIGLPLPSSQYSGMVVVADSLESIHTVRAEITTLGYASSAPEHLIASVQRYLHVVDIVLGSIGSIALVIAALGIANSLLSAVRERRREIGVLKAIGARDGDVLRWFLTEALVCGAVGGVLGTLFGLGAVTATVSIVNNYLADQGLGTVALGGVPLTVGLMGVLGSVVLALVAAAWPALRGARLPAREAVGAL